MRILFAIEAELGEDIGEVFLDGALTDHELVGDAPIGQPFGQGLERFAFAMCESFELGLALFDVLR